MDKELKEKLNDIENHITFVGIILILYVTFMGWIVIEMLK